MACSAQYRKGAEMGWFEHGSTIVILAPATWSFAASLQLGSIIRMGQPLFRMP
jgi:phosphatidylserine decarboxylase